jgi:hypothetical protein
VPFGQRDPDDPPASRFDGIPADDLIGRPVGSFDENIRLQDRNDLGGGVFLEGDNCVDACKGREQLASFVLWHEWPTFGLVPANRRVGIHSYDQSLTQRTRLLEVANVPGVEQIEHAVGEHDCLSRRTAILHESHGFLDGQQRAAYAILRGFTTAHAAP